MDDPPLSHGPLGQQDLLSQLKDLRTRIDQMVRAAADAELGPIEAASRLTPLQRIRYMQKLRRSRETFFGPGLFADPGWDIFLELAAAQLEGRALTVSQVCKKTDMPLTTALRWLRKLDSDGWIHKEADAEDGRRIFVTLTARGSGAMRKFLAQTD